MLVALALVVALFPQNPPVTYEGRPAPYWAEQLRDRQPDLHAEAIRALHRIGPEAVPILVAKLKEEDAWVRSGAALAMSGNAQLAVPALTQLLQDKVAAERHTDDSATYDGKPIAFWQALVEDKDTETRKLAKRAVSALSRWPSVPPRSAAAQTLGSYGASAKDAVSVLIEALSKEDNDIRWRAASSLGQIDPRADAVFLALVRAFGSTEHTNYQKDLGKVRSSTHDEAFEIIMRMRADAVQPLVDALQNDDPVIRQHAAVLLGRLGSEAVTAMPALKRASRDKNADVRSAAETAMKNLDTTKSKSKPKKK